MFPVYLPLVDIDAGSDGVPWALYMLILDTLVPTWAPLALVLEYFSVPTWAPLVLVLEFFVLFIIGLSLQDIVGRQIGVYAGIMGIM